MDLGVDLETIVEGLMLGLDAVILGFLYKSYESCSSYIEALKVSRMVTMKSSSYFFTWILYHTLWSTRIDLLV